MPSTPNTEFNERILNSYAVNANTGIAGVIGVIGTAVVAGVGFKLIARKPKKDVN